MKNGGKLKTENNAYNEASDDGSFGAQSKRQATWFNYLYFTTTGRLLSRKSFFWIDIAVVHTGIDHDWVNINACKLLSSICIGTHPFITFDNFLKLYQTVRFVLNFSLFIYNIAKTLGL